MVVSPSSKGWDMGTDQERKGRRTRRIAVAAALAVTGGVATVGFGVTPTATAAEQQVQLDPNGRWSPLGDWPLMAIHAALMPNGSVVTYGTDQGGRQTGQFVYDVWDGKGSVSSGHSTLANRTGTDLFCNIQIVVAETGELVMFGGDNWNGTQTTNSGNNNITVFNPVNSEITRRAPMSRARWYATATVRPDGSVFVQGGDLGADHPELWTNAKGARLLDNLDTSPIDWYYPRNFVIPDGRIFGVDVFGRMFFIAPDLSSVRMAGTIPVTGRGATAVMYQPGKILMAGGNTNDAVTIDVTGHDPVVTPITPPSSRRDWVNGTLLPDGKVLLTGGSGGHNTLDAVNYWAEIWDPATGQWHFGSGGAVPRLYHSTALLMPDGRVLVAGGGAPGPVLNMNAEIYTPGYLVAADGSMPDRPTITVAPDNTAPGQVLSFQVADPSEVARVTLVKAGSVTHSLNVEQRFVELGFTTNGRRVDAGIPANSAVVTPGYYLLTVLDADGIPSESKMVRIAPGAAPSVTPVGPPPASISEAPATVYPTPVAPAPGARSLSIPHSGLCADVVNGGTANGTRVQQFYCLNLPGQTWEAVPTGGGAGFSLRNVGSGKCLEVAGSSKADSAAVQIRTCSGGANQTMDYLMGQVIFRHSGKCLDLALGSKDPGARIQQFACNGSAAQRFTGLL